MAAALAAGLVLSCDEGRLVTEIESEPLEAAVGAINGLDTINVGQSTAFSAMVTLGGDVVTADALDWTADPAGLLAFDTTDHGSEIQMTGRVPGVATVRATIDHPDLVTDESSTQVVVMLLGVQPVVPSTGDTVLTALDQTLTLRARGVGDGAVADSAGLVWSHQGAALAVTPPLTGRDYLSVTAQAAGTDTLIFRQMDGLCREGVCVDTIFVAVSPTPARVTAPDTLRLFTLGRSVTAIAAVYDANDNPIPGASVAWSLVDAADSVRVAVQSGGTLTARANGSARVIATAGSAADTATVVVEQAIQQVVATPDLTLEALGASDTVRVAATDSGGATVARSYSVEWTSRDGGVATVSPLADGRAVVTAQATGTVQVVARAEDREDSVTVTVSQAPSSLTLSADAITLDALAATTQLDATVRDANGNTAPDAPVTWTSVDPGTATVSSAGLVTAVAVGATKIVATAESAADTVAVTVQQVPAAISVADPDTLRSIGATATLNAVVEDAGGSVIPAPDVTWTVVSETGSTVTLVGAQVTADGNGTAEVEARSGDARDTATVAVRQAVDAVALDATTVSFNALLVPDTVHVSVLDPGGTPVTRTLAIDWTSSAAAVSVAALGAGESAVLTSQSDGSAEIIITVEGLADSLTATVAQVVASVAVTPAADTLNALGDTLTLAAQALDANSQPVAGATVTWDTDAPAVVDTVDATSGRVVSVATGTATLSATASGITGTATVLSRQVAASLTVSPASPDTLLGGDQLQFAAAATDSNGVAIATPDVTWSSRDVAVATVDATGRVTGQDVAVLDSTRIVALSGEAGDSVWVRVAPASLDAVAVTPDSARLTALGATVQLAAQGLNQNGSPIPGETFTWSSANETVATVSAAGLVTAQDSGVTAVVATSDSDPALSDTATIVVEPLVDSVAVIPSSHTFEAHSESRVFTARAFDANGNPMAAVFTWSDNGQGYISFNAAGTSDSTVTVTSQSNGTTELIAAAAGTGLADTAEVTVTQVPAGIAVTPTTGTVGTGDTLHLSAEVTDANDAVIAGAAVTWTSLNTSVATVSADGVVTGQSAGTAKVTGKPSGTSLTPDTATITVLPWVLAFDGTDDYVTAGDTLDLTTAWTVELWVRPGTVSGTQYLLAKGGDAASQSSYGLYLNGANPVAFIRNGGGPSALTELASGTALSAGAWSHLAMSYDGATLRLYINGAATDSVATTNTPQDSKGALVFGDSDTGATNPLTGRLDEVRFWNTVRTGAQIAATFQAPLTGSEPGLLAYWALDEGAGDVATDAVGGIVATLGTTAPLDASQPAWLAEAPTIP